MNCFNGTLLILNTKLLINFFFLGGGGVETLNLLRLYAQAVLGDFKHLYFLFSLLNFQRSWLVKTCIQMKRLIFALAISKTMAKAGIPFMCERLNVMRERET